MTKQVFLPSQNLFPFNLKRGFFYCLLFFLPFSSFSQQPDTLALLPDSSVQKDTIITIRPLDKLLSDHFLLQHTLQAKPITVEFRKMVDKDSLFYLLALVMLILGILKASFSRYFSNLLRVFFNTSLRQSQLTDQLLQAKLPSLFFNIFFVLISGCYLFLLLHYFSLISYPSWIILLWCIGAVMVTYMVKYLVLTFAGWLTGYRQEAETYIFIVFLINKIIALLLMPLVIIIAFAEKDLQKVAVIASFVLIVVMVLMRFFRSYGLLQQKLKVSGFHFVLYILAVEILPILLIYKAALVIVGKYL